MKVATNAKRKELLTAKMKEAIYDAAVSVLGQYGVEGMTMERVAAEAKMAKGSLYCYYKSKQDLLHFVDDKLVEPVVRKTDELVATDMPALEKLEAMATNAFELFSKHRATFALLHQDASVRVMLEEKHRSKHDVAVRHYAAVFQQGIEEGVFLEMNPVDLAGMFFGAMVELFKRALKTSDGGSSQNLVSQLLNVFLRGALKPSAR